VRIGYFLASEELDRRELVRRARMAERTRRMIGMGHRQNTAASLKREYVIRELAAQRRGGVVSTSQTKRQTASR
jgi:hypothetical protein